MADPTDDTTAGTSAIDAAPDHPGEVEVMSPEEQQLAMVRVRKNYQAGEGADYENRRLHTEDLAFVYDAESGAQWDPLVLQYRKGRPSYTFNRCLQSVNMVLGDQRQTRPAIKTRPASVNATEECAQIFGGLWRDIEKQSRAEAIYDEQYKNAVAGGFGEMYLLPEFENDDSFDQVLRIHGAANPLTVIRNPECTDPCGDGATWVVIGERISKEAYEAEFGKEDESLVALSFDMARDGMGWRTDDMVRVVNYYERVPYTKEIALLSDGRVIDYTDKEKAVEKHLAKTDLNGNFPHVVRTRLVKSHKVRWFKCDGARILDGPVIYDWKRIPSVRMPGRYVNIEGKQKFQSLVRHAKDAQRSYNFFSSDAIERSALVPKARYLVTSKMLLGFLDVWNDSNATPRIYLPYNVDKDAAIGGGAPYREAPIDVPAGCVALAQKAADDIKATIGVFDPGLGNSEDMDRTSGKALVQHVRRSDLGTHEFIDNYGKALQLLATMGFDMMRTVYDGERVLRILHGDGSERHVNVNGQDEDGNIVNDLTVGSYEVTVTIGPSYQTAKQEELATMLDAVAAIPMLGEVVPDLITKAIDSADSDEMTKRLRKILIQKGVVEPTPQEKAEMPPPQQPNPQQAAETMRAVALAHRDSASAFIEQQRAGASDLEHRKLIANIVKTELANLLAAQKAHEGNPAAFLGHLQSQLMADGQHPAQQPPAQGSMAGPQ